MTGSMPVNRSKLLQKVVRRIVAVAKPDRIILFGSTVKGSSRRPRDLDLLVIKSCAHRRRMAMRIYERLAGIGCAVDVIVITPEDIRKYGRSPALVIEPALREGKVIYAA
jgi:predicted nucleotidyltransferase